MSESDKSAPMPRRPDKRIFLQALRRERSIGGPGRRDDEATADAFDAAAEFEDDPSMPEPAPRALVRRKTVLSIQHAARQRAVCRYCGRSFLLVRGGVLHAHDAHGKVYQAGYGDRKNPCLGSGERP